MSALPTSLGWSPTFVPLWHDDVLSSLSDSGWQSSLATSMSGSRFSCLGGRTVRLSRALSSFMLDMHVGEHGYREMSVPYVVSRSALEGTGQLPKFEADLFKIDSSSHTCNGEDAFLVPTSEVPLTNLHRSSLFNSPAELPVSYVALTPCFRAEAGSAGRDTRGLIRVHQFDKVELVKITTPEQSKAEHENLTRHAERVLEALELPYRRVRLCAGDIGFGAEECFDLEVWLPGGKEWREVSSCSNMGDFQARRMSMRFRQTIESGAGGGGAAAAAAAKGTTAAAGPTPTHSKKSKDTKNVLCHTINGSGLAVGRALVAVVENSQLAGGGIRVPEVLKKYMGGIDVIK